jgi:hypothetical protein
MAHDFFEPRLNVDLLTPHSPLSYADNRIDGSSIYNDWLDLFYANVSRYAMLKPYMLSPGNHEYPCSYAEYEARQANMPYRASGSTDMQYYSYTVGPVHVVALSGESSRLSSQDSEEMVWMMNDLEAAAAAKEAGEIAWIVTHIHYPNVPNGYCSSKMSYCCADGNVGMREGGLEEAAGFKRLMGEGEKGDGEDSCVTSFMSDLMQWVEDKFVEYGVDVHFTAHQHVYER